jgi:hypothetical protein
MVDRDYALARFVSCAEKFSPRVWRKGPKVRVYLTPPGWRTDAGFVDFTEMPPRIAFRMDSADAAQVVALLASSTAAP